jgi:lambda repressor-like predicted transcriptional regulator
MDDNKPKRELMPPRYIEYKGESVRLKQLAIKHGIHPRTLAGRIDKGWPIEKALTTPVVPVVPKAKAKTKPDDGKQSTRTKIINKLMDSFFDDPTEFERWIAEEKKKNYGNFYKTYIMPFLPKDTSPAQDRPQEKAIIAIEFNTASGATPPSLAIDGKVIDA